MGYRYDDLAPGEIYHVYTRGVEQRDIFLSVADRKRFLALLLHCLPQGPIRSYSLTIHSDKPPRLTQEGTGLIDFYCYCLMDNHLHLLLRENIEGGTSLYMRRLLTSYAAYFNRKQQRSGSLFLHPFKAVLVNSDEQFLHVSRYIHLNPYTAHAVEDIFGYPWSSLEEYTASRRRNPTCHRNVLKGIMRAEEYRKFITDEADYARSLADIKHLLLDLDAQKVN